VTDSLRDRVKRRLDPQTRGFARDTLKLSVATVVVVAGYATQIALITHFLGIGVFGVFSIVVAFVDLIGRFFNFQTGQMTMAFAADTLRSDARRTSGIAQFGYAIDGIAGLLAFLVICAAAPFAANALLGDTDYGASLFILYSVIILLTATEPTSIALLQLSGRFGTIARLTLIREVLRFSLVLAALLTTDSLYAVVAALVLMEAAMAVLWTTSATRATSMYLGGVSLWTPALDATRGMRREMAGTVFHTNVVSYVKILAAQGPTLLLGAMRSPIEVGAFKIGTSIGAIVGKLADPAWAAVLPRFAKLRAAGRRAEIRALIRQTSLGALIATSALGVVAIVLRDPLLRLFGGEEALAAAPVLVLAVIGRIINSALFWNSPLLYALKRAGTASAVFVGTSVVFTPTLVICTDRWGATGTAAAILFWSAALNAGLSVAAIRALRLVTPPVIAAAAQPG
jgi:O-antigen/teichoic acid export membrane protein